MSEKLVKKWLGEEKEKSKEREEQLKQKKDEELLELQNAIDLTLKNSFRGTFQKDLFIFHSKPY